MAQRLKFLVLSEVGEIKSIFKRQDPSLTEILSSKRVTIFGCGGLGSNIAMMLARSGVGSFRLYDFDKVEITNLNRQNYNFCDIGKEKADLTKKKLLDVISDLDVESKNVFVDENNLPEFVDGSDLYIEAFDDVEKKVMIFDYFSGRDEKLITVSGLSGLGNLNDIKFKRMGNILAIGDFKSDPSRDGLYFPYISIICGAVSLEALKILGGIYDWFFKTRG